MPTIFQDNLTIEFVYHALLSPLWPYRFGEANKAQDITLRESLGVDSLVLCELRLKSKDCFGNTSLTPLCRVPTLSPWRNILLFCLLVKQFVCLLLSKKPSWKKKKLPWTLINFSDISCYLHFAAKRQVHGHSTQAALFSVRWIMLPWHVFKALVELP